MRHWVVAGSGLLISMLENLSRFLFDQSSNTGVIVLKMDGSVLAEKSSFKMQGLSFSSKLHYLYC